MRIRTAYCVGISLKGPTSPGTAPMTWLRLLTHQMAGPARHLTGVHPQKPSMIYYFSTNKPALQRPVEPRQFPLIKASCPIPRFHPPSQTIASISTSKPTSATATVVRAGRGSVKNSSYIWFISAK